MKKAIISAIIACSAIVSAQLVVKPDANTLWQITSCQDSDWNGGGRITVKKGEKGGFNISDNNPSNKVGHSKFWKVPVSAEYPWFCCEVSAIRPFNGYRTWCIGLQDAKSTFGSATNGEAGIIAFNWAENNAKPDVKLMKLWGYCYDFDIDFKYIKLVKVPENYVYVESTAFAEKKSYGPGDTLNFKVVLKAPAEEVLLKLVSGDSLWSVKLNGSDTVELKPLDKEGKIWGAQVDVKSMSVRQTTNLKRGNVLLRATVLGGAVNVPIWGVINFDYKP